MKFISQKESFNRNNNKNLSAPIFYRSFYVSNKNNAYIYISSPNIVVCFINDKIITKDLFISSISVWEKTLYVNKYNVSRYLKEGLNNIKVLLGNGIKNEGVESVWDLDKEELRCNPEFSLKLYSNNQLILETDEKWKYTFKSGVIYNQYRVGEFLDARITPTYSENDNNAIITNTKKGKLTVCNFPAVRECEILLPKKIIKKGNSTFVIDFGNNISGYIEFKGTIPIGKEVVFTYCERLKEDLSPDFGGMPAHYKDIEFQTDKVIGNGEHVIFKPYFTYHGFRYLIINGIKDIKEENIKAYFIHQNIKQRIFFNSSNETLNKLFEMSINSILSNCVNIFTDCPTREKLGWVNDAMCSAETLLYLFDCKRFALKLLKDYVDSVSEEGKTVSLIPCCKWSRSRCNGIFTASGIFEYADKIYDIYGDVSGYKLAYDACTKIMNRFLKEKLDNGLFVQHYGLGEWVGPYEDYLKPPAPLMFTDSVLMYKCLLILIKASEILNKDANNYKKEAEQLKQSIINEYILDDGKSKIDEMSVLALLIKFDLYNDLGPLKNQLKTQVEKHDYHHYCGMISLRYLYDALDKCGLSDYAYKIIVAKGYPSYSKWIDDGETTLCETWTNDASHNHHMFSSFTTWIINTLCGFRINKGEIVLNKPLDFVEKIDFKFNGRKKKYSFKKEVDEIKYENN